LIFRSDGSVGDPVSGLGEHLQLGDCKRAQVGGADGGGGLGRHVHPTRLLCSQ
jgi:hypothetical protein